MIIAHVDMDSFFCSCEIKKDNSLKGKPIIVGSTGKRGVVSTSSY
ncbi:MAG: DNA polymerase IV, partial [Minisyncoccales bacterium]